MAKANVSIVEYEERCLFFVDMLGWSALVRRSAADEHARTCISDAYRRLLRTSTFIQGIEASDPDREIGWAATLLSDSLALSCRREDAADVADHVSSLFAQLLIRSKVYVRGAVVFGNVYHRANVIIGPALVRAVELEKQARLPRIVVDEGARGLFPAEMTIRDTDGVTVLDYLRFAFQNDGQVVANMRSAREVIEAKLAEETNSELVEKHRSLLQYVENVAERAARDDQDSQ